MLIYLEQVVEKTGFVEGQQTQLDTNKHGVMMLLVALVKSINFRKIGNRETQMKKVPRSTNKDEELGKLFASLSMSQREKWQERQLERYSKMSNI